MDKTAHDVVQLARAKERWTSLDFFEEIFDSFEECHGDRLFADDEAIVGGIARLDGKPVTVIGIQKGRDLQENIRRNFGSPHPEGYRKALRLMKQAEKFNRPVITLINTAGAAEAAELMKITAPELRELGIVDRVIPETFNGEQLPRYKVAHIMKKALIERLTELVRLDQHKLLEKRYKRFRQY